MISAVFLAVALWSGFTWRGGLFGLIGLFLIAPQLVGDLWARADGALVSPLGSGVIELVAVMVGLCVMVGLFRRGRVR